MFNPQILAAIPVGNDPDQPDFNTSCEVWIKRLDGREISRVLPMGTREFTRRWKRWKREGQLIQDAFNNLSPSEREFLQSGTTDEEWEALKS